MRGGGFGTVGPLGLGTGGEGGTGGGNVGTGNVVCTGASSAKGITGDAGLDEDAIVTAPVVRSATKTTGARWVDE